MSKKCVLLLVGVPGKPVRRINLQTVPWIKVHLTDDHTAYENLCQFAARRAKDDFPSREVKRILGWKLEDVTDSFIKELCSHLTRPTYPELTLSVSRDEGYDGYHFFRTLYNGQDINSNFNVVAVSLWGDLRAKSNYESEIKKESEERKKKDARDELRKKLQREEAEAEYKREKVVPKEPEEDASKKLRGD